MRFRSLTPLMVLALAAVAGCKSNKPVVQSSNEPKDALHVRPNGNGPAPTVKGAPPELQKVFDYIDAHIDEHVNNLQKWIQQPSISNSGEGIPESAEMVKGFFDKMGCQTTRVYDVGVTEYGTARRAIRWCTPSATRARPRRSRSGGSTTRCP